MQHVKAIVLRAAGVNCDVETEYAIRLAGASADRVHINRLIENPAMLDEYQMLVFPGGFSYGDDVSAGKILANQFIHHLADAAAGFISQGKLVLGICNGFQVLIKAGILPGLQEGSGPKLNGGLVSLTDNDSGRYEDRWVWLEPVSGRCVFLTPGRRLYLPVAHAEGKVVTMDNATLERLAGDGHIALKYVDRDGREGGFPVNPNGSVASIAGLTDSTGRVFGLMPHPERFVCRTQHPQWTRLKGHIEPDGMTIFHNAVKYLRENL